MFSNTDEWENFSNFMRQKSTRCFVPNTAAMEIFDTSFVKLS